MRPARRRFAAVPAAFVLASLLVGLLPALRVAAAGPVHVVGREVEAAVEHTRIVPLPIEASHVGLHWRGNADARLTIAFGRSPQELGEEVPVGLDEESALDAGETFSSVLWTGGARFARVTTDRPLGSLKVVAIDAGDRRAVGPGAGAVAEAALAQPTVISREDWGADESIRFDTGGHQRWPPSFDPLQKLFVHHTAGRNDDPNPEATIRAIYYFHANTRGWGDIGYNFLVDAQGRVYEGRWSRDYADGEPVTGEDLAGNVVRGAHAKDFNDGTVGVSLLGTFTNRLPTAAARAALERLLAWKAERHGIDPKGSGLYVNPDIGNSKVLNNISGHRNVQQTACPGEMFYNTFPALRQAVADRIAAATGPGVDHDPPTVRALSALAENPTGGLAIRFGLVFSEPVTGLSEDDLAVGGTSAGWSIQSIEGTASTYEITVVAGGGGLPDEGTVTLELDEDAVTDLAGHVGPAGAALATATYAHDEDAPAVVLYQTPHRAATDAPFLDFSVTFTEPVTGFELEDLVIGGTSHAASAWTSERIYGSGASYAFTLTQEVARDGTLTVELPAGTVEDLAGNPVQASNAVSVNIDRSNPVAFVPGVSLRAGTTLSGGSLRVHVNLGGSDVGPAGIASFDLARSIDGHAFAVLASGITGAQVESVMTPGHTYRYEVRARDRAGNLGAWKVGPTLTPKLVQQSSASVVFSGSTVPTSGTSYSGGSQRYLATAGAAARFATSARSLSFVTTRGPNRGVARIYVDGVLKATVDLEAASTTYRYVAFRMSWASLGTHTIRVVSGGGGRVDVDAFGVIR